MRNCSDPSSQSQLTVHFTVSFFFQTYFKTEYQLTHKQKSILHYIIFCTCLTLCLVPVPNKHQFPIVCLFELTHVVAAVDLLWKTLPTISVVRLQEPSYRVYLHHTSTSLLSLPSEFHLLLFLNVHILLLLP